MSEIYRRYEASPQQKKSSSSPHIPINKPVSANSPEKPPEKPRSTPLPNRNNQPKSAKPTEFVRSFIPKNIYNPETKKILGFLEAEDLLIIALIFLFMENSDDDNSLMIPLLIYILLADHIDLGDFLF
ncbi:MAG: hypothetical protein IJN96_02645 [Clostridia bacterium]|nr:hypothetical protein [Clostridia bacterium]